MREFQKGAQAQNCTQFPPGGSLADRPGRSRNETPRHHHSLASPRFDTHFPPMLPVETYVEAAAGMSENDALYAIRHADGSVSLYIDEEYAAERGVNPATLTRVEIPRELFSNGSIQQVREYVALYLEAQQTGTA